MKNFLLSCMLLLSAAVGLRGQDLCESGYLAFRQGVGFELTNYDKKGKVSSIQQQKVTNVETIADGFKATVSLLITSDKGKTLSEGSYGIECRNGVMYMDMSSMLDPRSMEGFKGMEMEISGSALEFPATLTPGQSLPDGSINMKAMTGGITLMNMSMNITNRKVEANETVTTPAGTFECVKMSQESEMKLMGKRKFRTVSWFAKGIGMVKSENLDDKGGVESSTVLTKFEQ
ncbi:MAG: hypothetical protein HY842_03975 [Bacteroidetes bacterium]|nr:hypothetical protein [Bacteroidota bacterium]